MSKKDKDEKIDATEVAKLPVYVPPRPTPYDKYAEQPSKDGAKDLYRDLKHNG